MKNQDGLIARLIELHVDNEKRIEQNARRITLAEKTTKLLFRGW